MKLTAQLKLLPTPAQADALTRTLAAANAACNHISHVAWETRTFKKYDLQKLIYQQVREQFGLSAQLAIRVIAKVGDAYKLDKRTERIFQPLGSVAFDDRILSYNLHTKQVSIWTVDGRLKIAFAAGARQMQMLQTRQGESDLVFHRGAWYLFATCDVPEPTPDDIDGCWGLIWGWSTLRRIATGQPTAANRLKHNASGMRAVVKHFKALGQNRPSAA